MAGGPYLARMVKMDLATHTYSIYSPRTASWPYRGVALDVADELGLQEILISGSFDPTQYGLDVSPRQWVVIVSDPVDPTITGIIVSKYTVDTTDDVVGYTDDDGLVWIGKLATNGLPKSETQWERQTLAVSATPGTYTVNWDAPPGTTAYQTLLQPLSTSTPPLTHLSPTYQVDTSHVPYLPAACTPSADHVSINFPSAAHAGIYTTYDVQLVR